MDNELLLNALRKRHDEPRNGNSRAWVYAEEVRISTGWATLGMTDEHNPWIASAEQRIDAFAFHTWRSQKYRRVAYEVKLSRQDLNRELNQPHKCAAALALSNEFYLVAPTDVLEGGMLNRVPETWGVIEWTTTVQQRLIDGPPHEPTTGKLRKLRKAPWRDTPFPPYGFMLSLARNLQAVVTD